jgi:hypothetical protein
VLGPLGLKALSVSKLLLLESYGGELLGLGGVLVLEARHLAQVHLVHLLRVFGEQSDVALREFLHRAPLLTLQISSHLF